MTLYEFIALNEKEQANATWEGDFLMAREEKDCTVMLYQVHNFYVEVYYSNKDNQITRFNPSAPNKGLRFTLTCN